jgi:type VI protein secretion system component VasA
MPVLPRTDIRTLLLDAQGFARGFPSSAPMLARQIPEPVTERLVEGVAYLAATVLDKTRDFQDVAYDRIAERVCPWLLRPVPSATIVAVEAAGAFPEGWRAEAFEFSPCTVRETKVRNAAGAGSSLEFVITSEKSLNTTLESGLSLYVGGELQDALLILHALSADESRVEVTSPDWTHPIEGPTARIERGGLHPKEALAPDPDGPPPPFGVVTEGFIFPHKFRFARVIVGTGLPPTREVRVTIRCELGVKLPTNVDVRTNCASATNLFDAFADPLPIDFDSRPKRIRVARGQIYSVLEVLGVLRGQPPVAVPDLRRLNSTPSARTSGAMYATSWSDDAELCIAFVPTNEGLQRGIASMRVLATDGPAAQIRPGDLRGAGYQNLVPASRFVPPPTGGALALRSVRAAAIRRGSSSALEGLREALFLSVPSWMPGDEWLRSMNDRIGAIETLGVGVARRCTGVGATKLGYRYAMKVNETPFQGAGELALFGTTVAEALRRCSPAATFTELHLEGLKTGFRATYAQRDAQ